MFKIPEVVVKPTLIFEEKIGKNEVKIQGEKVGDISQKFVFLQSNIKPKFINLPIFLIPKYCKTNFGFIFKLASWL